MKKVIIYLLLVFPIWVGAQNYELQQVLSEIKVEGSSNVHDWNIKATEISGTARINDQDGPSINRLTVTVQVKGLKSGKDGMDKKTYEALEADKHPVIKYRLIEVQEVTKQGQHWNVTAEGKLYVSGTEKNITLTARASPYKEGFRFEGNTTFKMTDYNVEPPTAMWGSVYAYDKITVHYNVVFVKSKTR